MEVVAVADLIAPKGCWCTRPEAQLNQMTHLVSESFDTGDAFHQLISRQKYNTIPNGAVATSTGHN